MRICAISDVHGKWNKLVIPETDLLISAGDYSFQGESHMVKDYHTWLNKQNAKYIISVQGNHETWVEKNWDEAKTIALTACPRVHFIDEGLVEIEGLKIYGSAITPWFHNWAWNRNRGEDIKRHWDRIPNDINVLITHGPAYGILDEVERYEGHIEHVGCEELGLAIQRLKPQVHICGHIHKAHGYKRIGETDYYNVSICNEEYKAFNPATEIIICK